MSPDREHVSTSAATSGRAHDSDGAVLETRDDLYAAGASARHAAA